MSDFLQQMLNDEVRNQKLIDAQNRADLEKQKEMIRRLTFTPQELYEEYTRCGNLRKFMKNENDLIPCNDELNRLKEFLAGFKKPALRYAGLNARQGCRYRP